MLENLETKNSKDSDFTQWLNIKVDRIAMMISATKSVYGKSIFI